MDILTSALPINNEGIEIVENSNGTAIKYPEGVMICAKSMSFSNVSLTAQGNIYKSGNLELGNWPLQFIEIPIVNTTLAITSGEGSLYSTAGVTKSYCGKCNVWRTTSSALGCTINIIGIGRWK